jgi:dTDP-D-glucose 4,6-dehydratase
MSNKIQNLAQEKLPDGLYGLGQARPDWIFIEDGKLWIREA